MAKKSFGRRFVEALKKIWKDEEEDIKKQGVEIAITAAEIAIPQIPDAYNKTRAWFEERKRKREEESKKDQRVEEEKKVESEESKTETETPDPRLSYLGCPPPILGERSRFEVGSTSGYNPDDSEPPLVLCQALPNTLVAIFFWLLGLWFLILFHFRHSHALAIPEQSYMSSLRNSCPVLSAEPPIYPRVLQPCDQFLIFACGGLLEHLSNPEEVQIVHNCPRADEAIAPTGLRLEMQLGTVFHMQGMASREYLDDLHAEAQDDFVISLTEQGVPGSYNEDAALIAYPGCETFPCDGFEASFKVLDQYESTLSKLGLVRVSTDDTAGAAQMVASQRAGGKGAVASVCAAAIYGLDILEERIQDDDDNITRYIMLAREPNIPRTNRPHKVEELLKEFDNVCTLRVRMRISNNLCNPRNFVTTISRCNKVVNIPNSMTILDELGEVSVVSKAIENYQDGRRFRYMQHATPEKNKRAER